MKMKEGIQKKKGMSFMTRLLAIALLPMICLVVILEIMSMSFMAKMARTEVKNELLSFQESTVQRYNVLNDKNYSYCGNGMMKGAIQISGDYKVIDALKKSTNIETTIFWGTESVASTLKDSSGKRMVGTKIEDKKIMTKVLKEGKDYYTTNVDIGGVTYYGAYSPLRQPGDGKGEIIGMIFTGRPAEEVLSQMYHAFFLQLLASIIILIVVVVGILITAKKIASALKHSEVEINKIADGELNYDYQEKYIARKDEIGSVSKAAHHVVKKLAGVIGNIVDVSDDLSQYSGQFHDAFDNMNQNLQNINTVVEEIAGGATNQANGNTKCQ